MRNVNDYLLIRHTPGGRQYPRLDCWGLIVDYYRENLGITLGEHTDLSHETMAAGMLREKGHFREVKTPETGDIGFCRVGSLESRGMPRHQSEDGFCRVGSLEKSIEAPTASMKTAS